MAYGCENVVAVRLNTEQLGSRWYPGAGIYRHVRLVSTERVHVDHWGVFVRTPQVNVEEASALVRVDIENHLLKAVKGTFSVEILETDANDRIGRKVVSLRGKEPYPQRHLLSLGSRQDCGACEVPESQEQT